MNRNARTDLFRTHKKARIRYQKSVRFQPGKKGKIGIRLLEIFIVRKDIHGHINLYAMFVGKGHAELHLFEREIDRPGPEGKRFSPEVNRIRTVMHGDLQRLQ